MQWVDLHPQISAEGEFTLTNGFYNESYNYNTTYAISGLTSTIYKESEMTSTELSN